MKVTLQVNGREMTFSEQELIAIVENHRSCETIKQVTTDKVAQKPIDNEWFEVNPQSIDQKLFERKRADEEQESTRKVIVDALAEMKKNPEKYGKKFKTRMVRKKWVNKTVEQLKDMIDVFDILDIHNANWVEQGLEWAQRISNGEPWEAICNDVDTSKWRRLVIWKDGEFRMIGNSVADNKGDPASAVYHWGNYAKYCLRFCVPLIVMYE